MFYSFTHYTKRNSSDITKIYANIFLWYPQRSDLIDTVHCLINHKVVNANVKVFWLIHDISLKIIFCGFVHIRAGFYVRITRELNRNLLSDGPKPPFNVHRNIVMILFSVYAIDNVIYWIIPRSGLASR